MPDQRGVTDKGATMRLGAYPCVLDAGHAAPPTRTARPRSASATATATRSTTTTATRSSSHGLVLSGLSPDGRLVEMIELPQHPYFVGCQFHPEFKSRPQAPHPLFQSFIAAALRARLGRPPRGARPKPAAAGALPQQ